MDDTPEELRDYAQFVSDIRDRFALGRDRGMGAPTIARILLSMSFEAALHAEAQDIFNHIIWTNSEAKRFMKDFEEKLGPKLDQELLAKGIVKAKA